MEPSFSCQDLKQMEMENLLEINVQILILGFAFC